MKCQTNETGKVTVLSVEGGLIWEKADDLKARLAEIHDQGGREVVLDLSKCEYINCAHFDLLVQYRRMFQDKGGDLRAACVNGLVRILFEGSNPPDAIRVFDSVEAAVNSFQGKRK